MKPAARKRLPFRFASEAYRTFFAIGDDDFARILPQTDDARIQAFMAENEGAIDPGSFHHENSFGFFSLMLNLHLGRHVSSENAYSAYSSAISYRIRGPSGEQIGAVTGQLRLREFISSMRVNILSENVQPFVRAGYGWNWFKADRIALDGEKTERTDTPWFHNPTFFYWPNTFHFGAGIELFPQKNYGVTKMPILGTFGKPEIGFRLEYTIHLHRLGDDVPAARRQGNITRQVFAVGFVVGF
ncbi:MAG: hypothetical protein D6743_14610 [Calditrichaeota bacterium]|nr:MAG: hypothetical protein D6743_14610 [Calditrichota bacterium]